MPSGGIRPNCSVPECDNPNYIRKCCKYHFLFIACHPFGELASLMGFSLCKNKKCNHPATTKENLCCKCYRRKKKTGNINGGFRSFNRKENDEFISGDGHVYIIKRNHKLADSHGYVQKKRLVWEEFTGDIIGKNDIILHKDGDRTNINIENLMLKPKTMTIKNCLYCNNVFSRTLLQSRGKQQFCSKECHYDYRRSKQKAKNCAYCSKPFIITHKGKKYCDRECCAKNCIGKRDEEKRLFSDQQAMQIREEVFYGKSMCSIAKKMGVYHATIRKIVIGETYADVKFPPYQ